MDQILAKNQKGYKHGKDKSVYFELSFSLVSFFNFGYSFKVFRFFSSERTNNQKIAQS